MPELRPGSSLTPAPLAQSSALFVGLGLFFVALLVGGLALFAPRSRRVDLIARFGRRGGAEAKTTLSRLSSRASFAVEGALDRRGKRSSLALALEKAGIVLRPGEFGLLVLCGSLIAFALGLLLANLLVGIVLAVLIPVAARFLVSHRASRRQTAFADQLNDTLLLLSGTLRAGYGFMQAADAVAREAEAPTSDEFRRLVLETRLGRPVEEALAAMHERVGSVDFGWVVQAIEINLESGGNLAEVLETIAGTIRERGQLRRQVKSLSAEGRMSGWILLALPVRAGRGDGRHQPGVSLRALHHHARADHARGCRGAHDRRHHLDAQNRQDQVLKEGLMSFNFPVPVLFAAGMVGLSLMLLWWAVAGRRKASVAASDNLRRGGGTDLHQLELQPSRR